MQRNREKQQNGKDQKSLQEHWRFKGTFHARSGTKKDRNGKGITEAEEIKKRWQKYTEEPYKKDLNDPDNHDGVITHLEPDILECEFKQALGSITTNKVSGGDGIRVELFQILKDDAVKVLHSTCQQIWKTEQWHRTGKGQLSNPKERQCQTMLKLPHNYTHFISYQKIILKILQARLQQYMNHEIPDVQAGFRKGKRARDQIANIHWIIKKEREFQNIFFYFIDYAKAFGYVDHNKLWKILQEVRIPDYLTCLLRNLYVG